MDPRQFAKAKLTKLTSKLSETQNDQEVKDALNTIVQQFPLLLQYWLQLIELSSDPKATWELALFKCPYSIDLWELYLNSPYGADAKASERAINRVGCFFLASSIWKTHLARTNNDHTSIKQAIRRQLYDYAEFYQLANDNHLESFNTLSEMAEIVSDVTTKKWKFESRLKTQTLLFNPLTSEELTIWSEYLDYGESLVISLKSTEFASTLIEDCQQLYEKCLSICTLYPKFWIRYITWLRRNDLPVTEVFERAIHYHPKNKTLRIKYSRLLESQNDIEKAREHLKNFDTELVAFDLSNKIEPSVKSHTYLLNFIKQTGDTTLLTTELILNCPQLFKSDAIDPTKLFDAWQKGVCPDPHRYAERLKDAGQLEMFFKVDSSLE